MLQCGFCCQDNTALYGACLASAANELLVFGVPSLAFPGLPMQLTVFKKDVFNQTITADSSTLLQIEASTGDITSASKAELSDVAVFKLTKGTATIHMAVAAKYSYVNAEKGVTRLIGGTFIVLTGIDTGNLNSLRSANLPVNFSSGFAACPLGYVLDLSPSSAAPVAFTGTCIFCTAGTYSLSPLVGQAANQMNPSCLECPTAALCSGGNKVKFLIGQWEARAGMFVLISCPPGHSLKNTAGSAFSQAAQNCVACKGTDYILSPNRSDFECQRCPVGAVCDGSSLVGAVPGSVWTPDMASGQYLLQSCPPGYEMADAGSGDAFLAVNQQCSPCPVSFYCPGGSSARLACPSGLFAPPLSNSSRSCAAAVFVALAVTFPMSPDDFERDRQGFVRALALTTGVDISRVLIRSVVAVAQNRRLQENGTRVDADIASSDAGFASSIAARLSTDALNMRLKAEGIAPGKVLAVTIQNVAMDQGQQFPVALVTSLAVGGTVLLVGCVVSLFMNIRKRETVEERQLDRAIKQLRVRLGITQENGFLVGPERPAWWRRRWEYTVVQDGQLEAAARISLYLDFDVLKFDSLCLFLDSAAAGSSWTGQSSARNLYEFFSRTPSASKQHSPAYDALQKWLLAISSALLRPPVLQPAAGSAGSPAEETVSLRQEERFPYLKKQILKARIWSENHGELFEKLQARARTFMDDIARLCDERYAAMLLEPDGERLAAFSVDPKELAAGHILRQDHKEVRLALI